MLAPETCLWSLFVSRTGFPDGTPSRQKLMKARYERGEVVQTWCHQEFMCRCRGCVQVVAMNSVERATETVVRVGARPKTKILHKLETGLTRLCGAGALARVWPGTPNPPIIEANQNLIRIRVRLQPYRKSRFLNYPFRGCTGWLLLLENLVRRGRGRPHHIGIYKSRRPSMAFSIVISSAYSMSLPTGIPMAMRVTRRPGRRRC
jgi:hypothetical protein